MKYLFFITLAVGTLIACAPKTTEALVTDNETPETASSNEVPTTFNEADVNAGKDLFAEKCISCHYGRSANNIPGLVDRFSKERWDQILPKMIENAQLNPEETNQIRQYIYWEISN